MADEKDQVKKGDEPYACLPGLKKDDIQVIHRDTSLLPNQVAGHGTIIAGGAMIFKPVNGLEGKFYRHINLYGPSKLRECLPRFYGVYVKEDKSTRYLGIENLTASYHNPCILDLKIGTMQHTVDMSPEKIQSCLEKCRKTTSFATGMRVSGMKIYHRKSKTNEKLTKDVAKTFTEEKVCQVLKSFLLDGSTLRRRVGEYFCAQLEKILTAMSEQKTYNLVSTSLLLVYDGAVPANKVVDGDQGVKANCKIIDFAHASLRTDDEKAMDTGCVKGIETTLHCFQTALGHSS